MLKLGILVHAIRLDTGSMEVAMPVVPDNL